MSTNQDEKRGRLSHCSLHATNSGDLKSGVLSQLVGTVGARAAFGPGSILGDSNVCLDFHRIRVTLVLNTRDKKEAKVRIKFFRGVLD